MYKSAGNAFLLVLLTLQSVSAKELVIISDPFAPWQFQAADGS